MLNGSYGRKVILTGLECEDQKQKFQLSICLSYLYLFSFLKIINKYIFFVNNFCNSSHDEVKYRLNSSH